MKVTRVQVFRQLQPFRRGTYAMHHGTADGNESFVVALATDSDVTGWGEVAMLGGFYSEAFASGTLAGLTDLAPALIGLDPTRPRAVMVAMDHVLRGQAYVKSAIDIACWDAAGRAAGTPVCDMLGGRLVDGVRVYNVVVAGGTDDSAVTLARQLVTEGYRRLQVKVGVDPVADAGRLHAVRDAVGPEVVLYADANGGFTSASAREFLRLTHDVEYTFEQPCATYEECAAIRGACDRPLVLDESITSLAALVRAHADGVADGITIKLGRLPGISAAQIVRDAACELGVHVTVESIGGASINTAAFVHLGAGVPEHLQGHTCDFPSWLTVDNATGLPAATGGVQPLPTGASGLGVEADVGALGAPLVDVVA